MLYRFFELNVDGIDRIVIGTHIRQIGERHLNDVLVVGTHELLVVIEKLESKPCRCVKGFYPRARFHHELTRHGGLNHLDDQVNRLDAKDIDSEKISLESENIFAILFPTDEPIAVRVAYRKDSCAFADLAHNGSFVLFAKPQNGLAAAL